MKKQGKKEWWGGGFNPTAGRKPQKRQARASWGCFVRGWHEIWEDFGENISFPSSQRGGLKRRKKARGVRGFKKDRVASSEGHFGPIPHNVLLRRQGSVRSRRNGYVKETPSRGGGGGGGGLQ